eukprot:2491621-Pleurochrysis_carterae.AAC.4
MVSLTPTGPPGTRPPEPTSCYTGRWLYPGLPRNSPQSPCHRARRKLLLPPRPPKRPYVRSRLVLRVGPSR